MVYNPQRIRQETDRWETEEIARIEAEYRPHADKLAELDDALLQAREEQRAAGTKRDKAKAPSAAAAVGKRRDNVAKKVEERDERIAEARRSAEGDRGDISVVGDDLIALYSDPDELLKHARVVDLEEIEENEFNLNVPRYVDTFEPEPRIDMKDALKKLGDAEKIAKDAETSLLSLLRDIGYAVTK